MMDVVRRLLSVPAGSIRAAYRKRLTATDRNQISPQVAKSNEFDLGLKGNATNNNMVKK